MGALTRWVGCGWIPAELEAELESIAAHNAEIQQIRQVPGIGLLTATALSSDGRSGRATAGVKP